MISFPAAVHASEEPDPEQVRQWVESGHIQPLDRLLAERPVPGRILDVELEFEHDQLVYEIKWLDDHGRRHKSYLDAITGTPLKRHFDKSYHDDDDDNKGRRYKED